MARSATDGLPGVVARRAIFRAMPRRRTGATDSTAIRAGRPPAQRELLEAYAKEHGLPVAGRFEESETAKTGGNRPAFARRLEFLGGLMSGDLKRGKYVYYSCAGTKKCRRFYPERILEAETIRILGSLQIDQAVADWILAELEKLCDAEFDVARFREKVAFWDEDRIAAPDVERARAVLLEDLDEELADLE